MADAEHLILGAGCAGLALAAALLDAGARGPITLVDARTDWEDDRTWCFWDTGDVPYAELSTHGWSAWRVVGEDGAAHVRRGPRYLHLPAERYYAALLDRLERAPNVRLEPGVRVRGDSKGSDPSESVVRISTSGGELVGRRVYDALGGTGPFAQALPAVLRQRFLGRVVRTERPVFDPMVATLMDFRVGQEDGLHFVYVLPFDAHTALVEDTHVGTVKVPAATRRHTIAEHLRTAYGVDEFAVEREERGAIAMTLRPFAREPVPGVWSVGTAAGAVRPSSGYAFARIQRHAKAVARAAVRGNGPPAAPGSPRAAALDRIFLTALERHPARFPGLFARLVGSVDGAVFARFMNDASHPADELRIAAAIPTLPLLLA